MIQSIAKSVKQRGSTYSTYVNPVYFRPLLMALVSRGWLLLDIMVCWYQNAKPLRQDRNTTIKVRLRRRRGQPVKLDDGSVVKPRDLILEIHLNNDWFLHNRDMMRKPGKAGLEFLAAFSDDLRYLAQQVNDEAFAPGIKAIHGRTLLRQGQGNQRLGFTVKDIPDSRWRQMSQFYLGGLRHAYYPKQARRSLAKAKPLAKKELWMSRSKLLERYGPSIGS